jgi:hypothetical protein
LTEHLLLERPRAQATATGSRVSARVDGVDLWFESPDVALRPSVEGFVAALLLPSLALQRPLSVAGHACPEFVANTRQIVERAHQEWGPDLLVPSYSAAMGAAPAGRVPRSALLFSGGVGSFHALLASGRHVDDLVFVQGLDIPLVDASRSARAEQMLREVAAATGTRAIVIRTNLRNHPACRQLPRERTSDGALAAVGHVLADHVTTAMVPVSAPARSRGAGAGSSFPRQLWSSTALRIEPVGSGSTWDRKLGVIANDSVVIRSLRVCREDHSQAVNCSRCEKCLLAQLALLAEGRLSDFRTFESGATLAGRLDRLGQIADPLLFPLYQRIIRKPMPEDVTRAASRLLDRSRPAYRQHRRRGWLRRVPLLPRST